MSKYTADDVQMVANDYLVQSRPRTAEMLYELAIRLRQEEEDNRRDPVTDPRAGDRVVIPGSDRNIIYGWGSDLCPPVSWASFCKRNPGAIIIRRREVSQ